MDRLRRLHRSPVLWCGLPILALALFYASDVESYPTTRFGGDSFYWAQYAATAVCGPIAGLAAWQAGRLRVGGVWQTAPVRHRHRIALDALRPVLALVAVVNLATFTLTSLHFGAAPRLGDLGGIGMMLTAQVALLVVGFGIGSVLPRAVSVPVAVVGLTLWLTLPPSLDDPTYRHLTGMLSNAPTYVDDPAPAALLAPVLLSAGAIAAVLLAARFGGILPRVAVVAACLTAAAVPAHALVADAGFETPTVPRSTAHQSCEGESPRICVPDEFADSLPELRKAANTALPRFQAVGITPPKEITYTSQDVKPNAGTWRIQLEAPISAHQLTDRVVTALVPAYRECPNLPDDLAPPSTGPLTAWLRLTAGAERTAVERAHSDRTLARVDSVREQDHPAQLRWVEIQRRAMSSCDTADYRKALR